MSKCSIFHNILKRIIKSEIQSQFERFLNQTLCVFFLTNERCKTYQTGFSFSNMGHAKGWDLGVPWGGGGGQKNFFSEIQPDLVEISSENTALFDLGSLVSLSMKHYPC